MQPITPLAPYFWPDTKVLGCGLQYKDKPPFLPLLEAADAIAGLVLDLNETGIDWLIQKLLSRPNITCSLLVCVYPACPTRKEHLARLLEIKQSFSAKESSVEFRILPMQLMATREHRKASLPPSSLQIQNSKTGESHFAVGSCGNFGQDECPATSLNLVFRAEAPLLDSWRKWFDWVWTASAPLTPATCEIPHLVPAEGELAAAVMWQAFEAQLLPHEEIAKVTVNPETGEVTAETKDGGQALLPTELNKIPKLDPLASTLAQLYQQGMLVTVDKHTRIPPLDAPVDPRWFGESALEERGGVQRKVQYRVSALEEKDLKAIEDLRKGATKLLDYFSFSLADSVKWMPDRARPLFDKALKALNAQGLSHLKGVVGTSVADFVEAKKSKIAEDARSMYQRINPGQSLPADLLSKILQEIHRRFEKALSGSLVPEFNFNRVGFPLREGGEDRAAWGQACSLLTDMALLMREPFAGDFFGRGMPSTLSLSELLAAMDLLENVALKKYAPGQRNADALSEVKLIKRIGGTTAASKEKCELLMALIKGKAAADIEKLISVPALT
jgi:hypothetical protein